jgi:hypothetical protein
MATRTLHPLSRGGIRMASERPYTKPPNGGVAISPVFKRTPPPLEGGYNRTLYTRQPGHPSGGVRASSAHPYTTPPIGGGIRMASVRIASVQNLTES